MDTMDFKDLFEHVLDLAERNLTRARAEFDKRAEKDEWGDSFQHNADRLLVAEQTATMLRAVKLAVRLNPEKGLQALLVRRCTRELLNQWGVSTSTNPFAELKSAAARAAASDLLRTFELTDAVERAGE